MKDKVIAGKAVIHIPSVEELKAENGTIPEVEKYISQHLDDAKLKEFFRFLIEQYGFAIEKWMMDAFLNGLNCAANLTLELCEGLSEKSEK